jgi:uncharacterized membrane protein YhfC
MIAMPIGLTIYLTRKFKQGWRLFWIGAGTLILSQVFHIPFNALVSPVFTRLGFITLPASLQKFLISLYFGLSAGLFEEIARYIMYRGWVKEVRTWGKGLLVGAGHGGMESIILGLLVLYGYVQMLIIRGTDISTLVKPDQVELAQAQIQAYWSAPWYTTMLGALERLFTIPLHLACSVLVLQVFTRKKFWWLVFAILYHALADGAGVFAAQIGFSAPAMEGIIGIFAIVSVVIIFKLRQPEPTPDPVPAQVSLLEYNPEPINETKENLDQTRYQ